MKFKKSESSLNCCSVTIERILVFQGIEQGYGLGPLLFTIFTNGQIIIFYYNKVSIMNYFSDMTKVVNMPHISGKLSRRGRSDGR